MTATEIIQQQANEIQLLKAELTTFQKRCEQYAQAYDQLQHQVNALLRDRFGKKSERFIDDNPQHNLFDTPAEPVYLNNTDEASADTSLPVAAKPRKQRNASHKELPRRVEIIPVNDTDRHCSCGCQKKVIRYEIKELLHHHAAVYEIIEQRREVVACERGCEGAIKTAPAPLHILPKAKASEEFLAFLVVSKLDDRQPLYHLEKQLAQRYGMDCSRQTMARWLIELKLALQPLYNLYKDQVIDYDMSSCDATGLQVLREPGRSPETKSYAYCIRGGPPNQSVILYAYNDKLHKQFVNDWFEGFNGYLHVDGDHVFEGLGESVQLVNCNAHARRKFEPIAQSTTGKGLAKEALRYFKALYKIEREAKKNQLKPEQRYALRQREAKPLLAQFKQWLEGVWPTVLPQSPLGKAIQYCLKLWLGLIRYLEDGRLEIDNNLTEQQIKPFVIARKNFLFCTSVEGAEALCLHFSLIRTAKLHGLDPYHYYVYILKRIPYCRTVEDYEKLLAWNIKLGETKVA
jgi:transposase